MKNTSTYRHKSHNLSIIMTSQICIFEGCTNIATRYRWRVPRPGGYCTEHSKRDNLKWTRIPIEDIICTEVLTTNPNPKYFGQTNIILPVIRSVNREHKQKHKLPHYTNHTECPTPLDNGCSVLRATI